MITKDNEDKKVIQEIRSLTGVKEYDISKVFLALTYMYAIGNYYNNEKITIPYFGTFKLKFEGDELDECSGNRLAKVTGFFSLKDDLKKNIGVLEDFLKTGDESLLLDLDSYKFIKNEIKQSLKLSDQI